jgi:sulfhydrogenase subunit beta (sulfur reductase)
VDPKESKRNFMDYVILKKERFSDFINKLKKIKKVIAPIKHGDKHFVFSEIENPDDITLKYIPTILPPKKYFMPQYETLIEYDTKDGQKMQAVLEYEEIILFGVHTCDIAGIQCLDAVFSNRPKDLHYLIRKNTVTVAGFECNEYCDEFASCGLMDTNLPNGGFDLFFSDIGERFMVQINTQSGEDIIEKTGVFEDVDDKSFSLLKTLREDKMKIFKNEVPIDHNKIPDLFDKCFDSHVWDEIGGRCISCANCTNVCPTCYCFDVVDEPNLDLKTGRRIRIWDSCQNEPFAKISSGESFRTERCDRKRHRFYRKFKYHVEKFNNFFCTGCGRCSRTCMAKINLKETLEALIKENA